MSEMPRVIGFKFDDLIQRPRGSEIALEESGKTEPNNSLCGGLFGKRSFRAYGNGTDGSIDIINTCSDGGNVVRLANIASEGPKFVH